MTVDTTATVDPYRLPRHVLPNRYVVRLEPDLNTATFSGRETITLRVEQITSAITMNAADLSIASAERDNQTGQRLNATIELDEPLQCCQLRFPSSITPGEWRLHLVFQGKLNDQLRGFYRSTYKDQSGTTQTLAATQFEATDAPHRHAVRPATGRVRRGREMRGVSRATDARKYVALLRRGGRPTSRAAPASVRDRGLVEKPTPTVAEQKLIVPGLRAGHYLCFFGMHVLTPAIFDLLDESVKAAGASGGVQLSPSLARLAAQERYLALEVHGLRYNIGLQYGLLVAQMALALNGNDRAEVLAQLLELLARQKRA